MIGRGFTQAELARRVGVAQPTIYSLIHSNKIGSKHLHRIARELGTTPAYLTGETDDPDADAPEAPELTHEERELIDEWRRLEQGDRAVLLRIAHAMSKASTVPQTKQMAARRHDYTYPSMKVQSPRPGFEHRQDAAEGDEA